MRPFTARTVMLTLVVVGCSGEAPTEAGREANGPTLSRQNAAAGALVSRPLSGRCETQFPAIPFPPPPELLQIVTGTCQLPHLGRTTLLIVQTVNFVTGAISSTETIFTAANGDVLRAVDAGTSLPSGSAGVTFSGTLTFVGGTGRFTRATGTVSFAGAAEFVTNTGFFTVDGTLTYDASDGSGTE
jgi:hypothetical protein